ncbi:MAG: hypothetical protein WDW38_007149 [Sanguina aurantia]
MAYWLVSLPLVNRRKDAAWELLQEKSSTYSSNYKLEIPELRVGTLDTLMALSDELIKTNTFIENVVAKIRRQVLEVGGSIAVGGLKVDGLPAEAYITKFKWEEAKYPVRRPLKETVDKISESVGRIEDELKVKISEYNALKSALSAATRKAGGSLAVRDINTVVKQDQVVDSENLVSLFVIVSKHSVKEWEGCYETLSSYVVPRSSKCVSEDNDYMLMSVVLFKRVVDDFKAGARSKGYQVREYVAADSGSDLSAAQSEALRKDVGGKKAVLEQWCKTAYGEAFSAWMHSLSIRLFVESILRYGLPPAFQAAVVRPKDKIEAKLRAVMAEAFGGDAKSAHWKDDGGSSAFASLAGDAESQPYVSLTMSMDTA